MRKNEEAQLSIDPKRGKTIDLYTKREKENSMPTAKAGAQSRVPVPSSPPQHGGRRGWWGQARPMGAASHRPHARVHRHRRLRKPPGQIPSQHDGSVHWIIRMELLRYFNGLFGVISAV